MFADQVAEDPRTWNLYSYGRNNPLNGKDPDGHIWHVVAGAAGGYLTGALIETGKQLITGSGSFSERVANLDGAKINAKGLNGAIVGGTAAATGGLSLVATGAAIGAASAVGGVVERATDGDKKTKALDPVLVTSDAITGAAFGVAGKHAQNIAVEAAKKTGDVAQKLTRGESFIRQGTEAGDVAKIAKGQATLRDGNAMALNEAGNPGQVSLTVKQETLGTITSSLREDQLSKQNRKKP